MDTGVLLTVTGTLGSATGVLRIVALRILGLFAGSTSGECSPSGECGFEPVRGTLGVCGLVADDLPTAAGKALVWVVLVSVKTHATVGEAVFDGLI